VCMLAIADYDVYLNGRVSVGFFPKKGTSGRCGGG